MLVASQTNDPFARLADDFDGIALAYRDTPPQFLPFVVWQFGLGELSPYLPNLYQLVRQGVRWQRVRGTPRAIAIGLGWLGYAGTLEEEPTRRRKWNRFQIELDRIRDADLPDLIRIEGIVSLSPPARSDFFRGYRGYDVRACELSHGRMSRSTLSSHSGVRLGGGKAKWSFGRRHDHDVVLGKTALTALGTWIEPIPDNQPWGEIKIPWTGMDFRWDRPAVAARLLAIATAISKRRAYVAFKNIDNEIIGYRRAVSHPCRVDPAGEYYINRTKFKVDADAPSTVIVSARSGFGDGSGTVATKIGIVFDPVLSPGLPQGRLWLSSSQASGGIFVAETATSIPLGLTIRETCNFILRF